MKHESTWHEKHVEVSTIGQRLADIVAYGMGSWRFIIIQTLVVIVWIIVNFIGFLRHWDPYPFILLNLLFSLQAAYAAPIIMMSQNRQNDRDREQAKADYQTNVEAKLEIEALQQQLSNIEVQKLDKIIKMLQEARGANKQE
jgi:uncharacterized membrane protein